jgi:hypothetical protein
MEEGHPEYGCFTNPAKTKASFSIERGSSQSSQPSTEGVGLWRSEGADNKIVKYFF